jgi:hypothetical protein
MRSLFSAVIVLAGVTAASAATTPPAAKPAAAAPKPPVAVVKLTPDDIQKTFFTGQSFKSATPSGVSFEMIFAADGKMTRKPLGKGGAKGEGTWALDKAGFCTTWKGAKPNCFTVVSTNDKKWSVMRGSAMIAVWTK